MTKYLIRTPEPQFSGDLAGLVFRAGEARAETPQDLAAVTYCRRRGYTVLAVDRHGEPLSEDEQPDSDTPDPDVTAFVEDQEPVDGDLLEGDDTSAPAAVVDEDGDETPSDELDLVDFPDFAGDAAPTSGEQTVARPADYASKADWVTYAVSRGASEDDAKANTKNELVELYG